MSEKNHLLKTLLLVLLLMVLFCLDVIFGSISISISDFFTNILSGRDSTIHTILWQFRLPKAITCTLTGASLAISGFLMQTLFRNPLAGPVALGLSSGASLAVGALVFTRPGLKFSWGEGCVAI